MKGTIPLANGLKLFISNFGVKIPQLLEPPSELLHLPTSIGVIRIERQGFKRLRQRELPISLDSGAVVDLPRVFCGLLECHG